MHEHQVEKRDEYRMMKMLNRIQSCEAQKHLLETTLTNNQLLNSKIISSLQPNIGKEFKYPDLETRKDLRMKALRK